MRLKAKSGDPVAEFDTRIAGIGVFLCALTGLSFALSAGDLGNPIAILKSVALGIYLQLGVWYLRRRLGNYGRALLAVLVCLLVLCFLPYGQVLLYLSSAALFLTFLWTFLQYKIELKKNLLWVAGLGFLYWIMVFGSTARNVGDPFINEKIRQFTLNPDTLFFASVGTMFKNYFQIATGLNGFSHLHYHFLSQVLYAWVSGLLGVEVYEVYGYTNFIAFACLLVTGFLWFLCEIPGSVKFRFALVNLVLLGGPFSEALGWQENNHFMSESYLVGLLLLSGALSLLFRSIQKEWNSKLDWVLLGAYLPLASIGKISVGFILFGCAAVALICEKARPLRTRIGLLLCFGLSWYVGYHFSRGIPIPRLEVKFAWKWYQHSFNYTSIVHLIVMMFPYAFLALPWVWVGSKFRTLSKQQLIWLLAFLMTSVVGFAALNITIDSSGYYFSNIHAFVALPLMVLFLGNDSTCFQSDWRKWLRPTTYAAFICTVLAGFATYYFLWQAPHELFAIAETRAAILEHRGTYSPYLEVFKKIREDADPLLMVYIPKTETAFWDSQDDTYAPWKGQQCVKMPFFIPILTGKPGLFALPDPKKSCYTFHRGYESYTKMEHKASGVLNYSHSVLCNEVRSWGFHGYYRVSEGRAEKQLCSPTG